MAKHIAILATLDTKGPEAQFVSEQLQKLGAVTTIIDIGVVGNAAVEADVSRTQVAERGGTPLAKLLINPTREQSTPVMARGTLSIVTEMLKDRKLDAIIGLGGLQGTALSTSVMRELPYGFPKIMVSTVASGDTSPYVDIKDITMMFSVGDILGLNPFTRKILAKAAGAAFGMASIADLHQETNDKPVIGMSNLGVLTRGAMKAVEYFEQAGYEVIVFHAIGSGGRAMEQMIKEGIIGAVFDYALGEIADDVFGVLRSAGPERLTVAGKLGLPQVICPGGAEHLGILVEPNQVPAEFENHTYVWHSPVVFVPRLNAEEQARIADDILRRLRHTTGNAAFMIPTGGTSRYAVQGGVLHDPVNDTLFFDRLKSGMPAGIEVVEVDTHAEDPVFVKACVDRLIRLIESRNS